MRRFLLAFIALTLVLTTLVEESDAARRKKRTRARAKTKKAVINEKKLYERIGSQKGIAELVDEWLRASLSDPKIGPVFSKITANPERLAKFRRSLNDELCEITDGPCPEGPEMKTTYTEMKIDDEQFLIFADYLYQSLQKSGLPEREKNELLGRMGEVRTGFVTGDASSSS